VSESEVSAIRTSGWWSLADGRRSGAGVASCPGEGGEQSIGEELQDHMEDWALEKDSKCVKASGKLLTSEGMALCRVSHNSNRIWVRAGDSPPCESATACSMATMVQLISLPETRGAVFCKLSTCAWDSTGEDTACGDSLLNVVMSPVEHKGQQGDNGLGGENLGD
jgi:hypothetical protein